MPTPDPYTLLRLSLERYQAPPSGLDESQRAELDQLATQEERLTRLILASDEAQGVVVPSESVKTALAQVRDRYPDPEEFLADLERNDLDEPRLAAALSRELRVEAVLDRVAQRHAQPVTQADARAFYDKQPERFTRPETRTVRHLLITINPDYPDNTPIAARLRMTQLREQIAADTGCMETLAQKYSECPSALHGGMVGRVNRGQLHPPLDEALFQLQAGEVSEIIETNLGLHLVLCEAVHPAGPAPFEEVCDQIQQKLHEAALVRAKRAWVRTLG